MRHYVGVVHKEAESEYGISFPDFPGCVSAGRTLSEAVAMGGEALEGHITLMREMAEVIPEPSSLESAMASDLATGGAPVLIAAPVTSVRLVSVDMDIPEDALREIDSLAEGHGLTRAGFLISAAKRVMADA